MKIEDLCRVRKRGPQSESIFEKLKIKKKSGLSIRLISLRGGGRGVILTPSPLVGFS